MKKIILSALLVGITFSYSQAQELLDLLKHDLNKEKRTLVSEAMDIKEEHKATFWQLYGEYESTMNSMADKRAQNIEKFADNYGKLTDDVANEVASTYFDIKVNRLKTNKLYYKKMKKVIGAIQAARFIQIMEQVQLLIDVQIAAEVPLVE